MNIRSIAIIFCSFSCTQICAYENDTKLLTDYYNDAQHLKKLNLALDAVTFGDADAFKSIIQDPRFDINRQFDEEEGEGFGEVRSLRLAQRGQPGEQTLLQRIIGTLRPRLDNTNPFGSFNPSFLPWTEEIENCLSLEFIPMLIARQDLDINACNNAGETALHRAVKQERADVVTKLLSNRKDIQLEIKNKDGFTPYVVAVLSERFDLGDMLVSAGAKTNALPDLVRKLILFAKNRETNVPF